MAGGPRANAPQGQCESLTTSSVNGNTIVAKSSNGSSVTIHTTASTRYTQAGKFAVLVITFFVMTDLVLALYPNIRKKQLYKKAHENFPIFLQYLSHDFHLPLNQNKKSILVYQTSTSILHRTLLTVQSLSGRDQIANTAKNRVFELNAKDNNNANRRE
jgi:hypothetical protein